MKLSVVKEFTWDCAHMLSHHEGLCKNIHGHTYKMLVEAIHFGSEDTYSNSEPAKEGMVVDFKQLKTIVNSSLVDKLDHAFIVWNSTEASKAEKEIHDVVVGNNLKCFTMSNRPTAENMAKLFFAILDKAFKSTDIKITAVTVYETPTSCAVFRV